MDRVCTKVLAAGFAVLSARLMASGMLHRVDLLTVYQSIRRKMREDESSRYQLMFAWSMVCTQTTVNAWLYYGYFCGDSCALFMFPSCLWVIWGHIVDWVTMVAASSDSCQNPSLFTIHVSLHPLISREFILILSPRLLVYPIRVFHHVSRPKFCRNLLFSVALPLHTLYVNWMDSSL